MVWHKKFGLAQNILGPVKGQGTSTVKIGFLQVLINGNAALKGRVITEVTNFFQNQLNMAIL